VEPVPVEPVADVAEPFDDVGLLLELVPGVDEVDGQARGGAAVGSSSKRHTLIRY